MAYSNPYTSTAPRLAGMLTPDKPSSLFPGAKPGEVNSSAAPLSATSPYVNPDGTPQATTGQGAQEKPTVAPTEGMATVPPTSTFKPGTPEYAADFVNGFTDKAWVGNDPSYWTRRIAETGGLTDANKAYWAERMTDAPNTGSNRPDREGIPAGYQQFGSPTGGFNMAQLGGSQLTDPNFMSTLSNMLSQGMGAPGNGAKATGPDMQGITNPILQQLLQQLSK